MRVQNPYQRASDYTLRQTGHLPSFGLVPVTAYHEGCINAAGLSRGRSIVERWGAVFLSARSVIRLGSEDARFVLRKSSEFAAQIVFRSKVPLKRKLRRMFLCKNSQLHICFRGQVSS
jgi:hypothetical protein